MMRHRINGGQQHRSRGSAYIAVLGVSLLVAIIGLSTLINGRTRLRIEVEGKNTVQARSLAQSGLELILQRINQDNQWRNRLAHDTWSDPIPLDEGEVMYKLVDERDGNLINDDQQPVRLYARANVGEAVRIYSILIEPPTIVNLLNNSGMEQGTRRWTGNGYCELIAGSDQPRSGQSCLHAKNRSQSWSGPNQNITGEIELGKTYKIDGWVRLRDYATTVKVTLLINTTTDGDRYDSIWVSNTATGWRRFNGKITPTGSGEITHARLYVETQSGTQDFYIDDMSMVEDRGDIEVVTIPGTLRREVLP